VLDPSSRARREALLDAARGPYLDDRFDPSEAAATVVANAQARGAEAREIEEGRIAELDLSSRDAEQRVKRAARGAEREELLAQLEELAAWYRDLVAVAVGADDAAIHLDKLAELRADATRERILGAEGAAEAVRELWRELEELNLAPQLALEALFVRIARELAA
jgi:DNA polymerase-3 subunit delta'